MREDSPTSLSAYVQCPHYYDLTYNRGIRTLKDQYSMLGTSVHKVLEKFWDEYKELGDIDGAIQESINKYWDINIIPEFSDIANTMFQHFTARTRQEGIIPLFLEQKISNSEMGTVCIVDRIDLHRIVDYKTSSLYTAKPKIQNIIQGVLCFLNVEDAYGLRIDDVEFWYLRLNKTQKVPMSDQNINMVFDLLGQLKDAKKEDNFPKNEKNCKYCYYKVICEKEQKTIDKRIKEARRV